LVKLFFQSELAVSTLNL